ncbi:MAG: hypothetical protein IPP31_10575 [Chitinophagaceae bacterium]|nr:hypothetical protein [Chitinophagaceae bacterium]
MNKTLLKKGVPVTKSAVLGEISRLVELYRNNGYYKFTSEELKMRGDTTAGALTTISDDIFEQIRLLAEAQAARDSPPSNWPLCSTSHRIPVNSGNIISAISISCPITSPVIS